MAKLSYVGKPISTVFITAEMEKDNMSDNLTKEMFQNAINSIYDSFGYNQIPIIVISPKQMEAKKQREELHENKETYSEHTKGFILNFKEV